MLQPIFCSRTVVKLR